MSRTTKLLSLLVTVLVVPLLLVVLIDHVAAAVLPDAMIALKGLAAWKVPVETVASTYLFWTALVLLVVWVIVFISILVWPRTRTELTLVDKDGQLLVSKSAVEGLVKSTLARHDYMKQAKVTTKLYKRQFKVFVKGDLSSTQDVVAKTARIKEAIEADLRDFVGLEQPLRLRVDVAQVEQPKAKRSRRVE